MVLGLYIHVPFCLKKCYYCNFVSYPVGEGDMPAYLLAVSRELRAYARLLSDLEKSVTSLYIGGGTPTCLQLSELVALIVEIHRFFNIAPGSEVTVEANPCTVKPKMLAKLRQMGVNRLSLGVQAFQDRLLKVLGRQHNAREAVDALQTARRAGFANINLDIIFGIPGQSLHDWCETLDRVLDLAPEHVSVYGFQPESGTPLQKALVEGKIEPCSEEVQLIMYKEAGKMLKVNGYEHYEIANFAREGFVSRHNLALWLNQPYLGIGPAACSYIKGERYCNHSSLEDYSAALFKGELPVQTREIVKPLQEMAETLILGLRLLQGVDRDMFYDRFGCRLEDVYGAEMEKLIQSGLIENTNNFLRLTKKGLPLANRVFVEFV